MKNKTTLLFIIIILAMFYQVSIVSAAVEITAQVDKNNVTIFEQLKLTMAISGNLPSFAQPNLPELSAFEVYSAGRSQNISIINGQLSSSTVFTFILVPQKAGEYTLKQIEMGGKAYNISPVKITVSKSAPSPPNTVAPSPGNSKGKSHQQVEAKLFVEAEADKTTAYVNQQIVYSFRFYRAINLMENPEYQPADFTGFWTEDLPPQRQFYEGINGRRYLVTEVKTALFPTSAGEYTISPARLTVIVDNFFSGGDPFSFFDRGFPSSKPQILETNSLKIQVLPLPPTGKPAQFEGAVGEYKLETSVDKASLKVNEPLSYKIKVSGKGNIKTIPTLNLNLPVEDFKKYESGSSQDVVKDDYQVSGQRAFEYVLIPQKSGELVIPALEFTFFNPAKKTYEKIKSESYKIKVAPSPESKTPEMVIPTALPTIEKKEIELLTKDINHIKTISLEKGKGGKLVYKTKWFIFFLFFLPLTVGAAYLRQYYLDKLAADKSYARQKRARSQANKRLAKAKKLWTSGQQKEFFAEVHKALNSFLADKLDISAAYLSVFEVEQLLSEKKIDPLIITEVKSIIQECDLARFAQVENRQEFMKQMYKKAASVIQSLEKGL